MIPRSIDEAYSYTLLLPITPRSNGSIIWVAMSKVIYSGADVTVFVVVIVPTSSTIDSYAY